MVAALLFFAQKFSKTHRVPLPIAIINLQRLYEQSEPFTAFRSDIDKKHEKAFGNVREEEKKLRSEYEKLKTSQNISKAQLAKRKTNFDKRVAELEKKVQKERGALTESFKKIDNLLKQKVQSIVRDLSNDYQVKLIINTQVGEHDLVVYAETTLNLTNELIERVNKQIKYDEILNEAAK